jgi:hypothetical protein
MSAHTSASADEVVMIDCPDPNNVLMALWVLKNFPDSHVAVVLSIRPVSFKAARYGAVFQRLLKLVGNDIHRMIDPLTEQSIREADRTWLKELSEKDRAWFGVSPDLADETVQEDTRLYMLVSAFRMSQFWRLYGIDPTRYCIYWDEHSLTANNIQVGMSHAFHVHDWSFDFDQEERARYDNAIESISGANGEVIVPVSEDYRRQNRAICDAFVQRMAKEHNMSTPQGILRDLRSGISANNAADVRATLFLGGPFADALTYIQCAPVEHITAMGWNIREGSTLFKLQFNVHVAPKSADNFLRHVSTNRLRLSILPTECVKNTVFALSKEELLDVFHDSSATTRLNQQYHDTASEGVQQTFALFDIVAALTARHPYLYPRQAVRATQKEDPGMIEWIPDVESTIEMFYPDHEQMARTKLQFLEALRSTVT